MSDYKDTINAHLDQLLQIDVLEMPTPGKYKPTAKFRKACVFALEKMYTDTRFDEDWTNAVHMRGLAEAMALHQFSPTPIPESEAVVMLSILVTIANLKGR